MSDAADRLRRLADACEREVCEVTACAHDIGTVALARYLADAHDALGTCHESYGEKFYDEDMVEMALAATETALAAMGEER